MGYAAQGYQSSSSRLPVKIPILICSMVLHAYLFFSALEKIRQLRVQSIIPVGCRLETEGYMTLPEHFPFVINFQNLRVEKGLVSQRMKSIFSVRRYYATRLIPPPRKK